MIGPGLPSIMAPFAAASGGRQRNGAEKTAATRKTSLMTAWEAAETGTHVRQPPCRQEPVWCGPARVKKTE